MTTESWPYAGVGVTEDRWRSMGRLFRRSGVIDGAANELAVTEVTGQLQVQVATGEAWLDGHYLAVTAAETLNLATADLNNDRIDLVVARSDADADVATVAVITGTPAVAPVAPTVTQDHDVAGIYEIALAEVRVVAASGNVDGQVTDVRTWSLDFGTVSDTAPADPSIDDLWYDSSADLWKRWTGTAWVAAGNAAYEPIQTEEGFRAYRSTNQTLSAATYTTMIFDTEVRDQGADYNTATGEWTVPATGWYDVAAAVLGSWADGERVVVRVAVGGVNNTRLADMRPGAAGEGLVGGAAPVYFTIGDVVTIQANRANAGDVVASTATYFTAKRRYVA